MDCSDHEVNIKILLDGAVADGELTEAERDELLAEMTDEVGRRWCCATTTTRPARWATPGRRRASLLPVHRRMISELERAGQLDRALGGAAAATRSSARRGTRRHGLTAPEFAVLLAYAKIDAGARDRRLDACRTTRGPAEVLGDYFPTPLRERFADRMAGHPLRREIITTAARQRGGQPGRHRRSCSGRSRRPAPRPADVIRAYVVVRDVFGLR